MKDFERILTLAQSEREARKVLWKIDTEEAFKKHGEAVDALYDELYRQLDERMMGQSTEKSKIKKSDPVKDLKKEIVSALKKEIPSMVENVICEFEDL